MIEEPPTMEPASVPAGGEQSMAAPTDGARPASVPTGGEQLTSALDEGDTTVRRSVDVGASVDDVWRAVTDPAERSLWLDDPDALARHIRLDEAIPHQRLVWTWWRPGDDGTVDGDSDIDGTDGDGRDTTTVSIVLTPLDGGSTRVDVTERRLASAAPGESGGVGVGVNALAGRPVFAPLVGTSGDSSVETATVRQVPPAPARRQSPGWVRCAHDRWVSRLLGLELMFAAARVPVA